MKLIFCILFFCLAAMSAITGNALADDNQGHHHEALTSAQLGTVAFPVSCDPSVQKPFERGVALLHSFWYEEAEREFQQISANDPHCAMARWGVAMSLWHQLWNHPDAKIVQRGLDEIHQAKNTDGPATPREKAYITAIAAFYENSKKLDHEARAKAYSDSMKKVYASYPDDHEAAIFYALSLLAYGPHDDATFANRKQAAAILETLFATEPDHPGVAHYLIHSYDKPQLAQLGLPAARRYAQVAPAAPHALHMPSHIFARVGLWQEDINSNLASIAATRKNAAMHMGGEGHQFHAMDFLFYAYMQSGHDADAKALIEEIRAMPNKHDDMYGKGYDPHAAALVHLSALYPIEMHDWASAAALPASEVAGTSEYAVAHWARAIGSARLHKPEDVRKDIAAIESVHKRLIAEKSEFADAVENDLKTAHAWLAFAEGKADDAVEALRPIADREDSVGDEPEGIPAREMIADVLLEARRSQQALTEYQADLKLYPNRFDGLYGAARAAEAAGKQKDATEYYALLLKVCDGSNSTRPELSHARELVAQK
ncbi:MAG: repeat protein [Candidatus Sulfotelmatobacter sp.]|nr:repeat protein [Candidatus Sulfotelmatobacter sp.]